jgi:PKD repeat protein
MPVHDYADVGVYSVSLMVIDNSTTPHRIAFDYTTVRIFVMPAPEIDIEINKPSWGIQATIKNDGIYNATQINWTIKVRWGLIQERKVANGTIERLGPNNISEPMKSGYFLKFGIIHIEISAIPENIPGVNKEFTAFKIGPFVLNAHETLK